MHTHQPVLSSAEFLERLVKKDNFNDQPVIVHEDVVIDKKEINLCEPADDGAPQTLNLNNITFNKSVSIIGFDRFSLNIKNVNFWGGLTVKGCKGKCVSIIDCEASEAVISDCCLDDLFFYGFHVYFGDVKAIQCAVKNGITFGGDIMLKKFEVAASA